MQNGFAPRRRSQGGVESLVWVRQMENGAKTIASLGLDRLKLERSWESPPVLTGLSVDSRGTKPGHVFFGLPGTNLHGAEFADYARRMGAVLIVTDPEGAGWINDNLDGFPLPVLVSENARLTLSQTAARWFDAQPEIVAAVTGTNGKTSVASFLRQIWEEIGHRAVNFGTTGIEGAVGGKLAHTTPEPITLHRLLSELAAEGVTHAAMEASSHGLAQHRVTSVDLRAAAFTNISRDHLDYHYDFADYFAAKSTLFTRVLGTDGLAVINLDDAKGPELAAMARHRGQRVIGVGKHDDADFRLTAQRFDARGQNIRTDWGGIVQATRLDLIGGFQAFNVITAAAMAIGLGEEPNAVVAALPKIRTVRGRMERAATRANGAEIFVDYSHTPDALKTALVHLRPHVMGRLIVVFGAGGDRDPGKRALMGEAARFNADVAYVTDDNPRTEDPAGIRAEILRACPNATEIGDRAEAILAAVDALLPGDALLIAGKGHETGQIIGQDRYPFDDIEQASIAVAALDGIDP